MSTREVHVIADAINQRYHAFENGGAIQFGIEEAVYAVAEMLQANHLDFDPADFKHRCFADRSFRQEPIKAYSDHRRTLSSIGRA